MSVVGEYLSIKQVDQLINNLPSVVGRDNRTGLDSDIIQLLFKIIYHGMIRTDDAVKLKKSDFDYPKKIIQLRRKNEKALISSESVWREILHYIRNLNDEQFLFRNVRNNKPITRQIVYDWNQKDSKITGINTDIDVRTLWDSRAHHLRLSKMFTEPEINQLFRGDKKMFSGIFVPSSDRELLENDQKANEYLRTYCEGCKYKNPSDALFCCRCGHSLSENKSILN